MDAKKGSHFNSAQSIHLRSSDPSELSSLRKPTMNTSRKPNPILPAPGVSRNPTINTEASRSQQRRNEDVAINRNSRGHLQHIGILGVQEHRIIHSDPIEYIKFDTSTLVNSSGWRNKSQAAQGGVGLLLDRKARKSLLKVVPSKSGRILVAEFDGNPLTTILVIYAPTNYAEESVIEEFYTELRNVLQDVPAHNFLALMGDFNARLGPEHVPHPFHELTNRSGNYLAEILVEFGLLAVNTQFKKRPGKLWTFKCRASNTLRQLDYILVRQKWRNSVHNAEAYNSFSTVKSDHRIVSAKIKLSLRT
ncbi:craniofacial development protein 2-like [Saccostrea cucullata]|uniref:craniofacial development protein 2-like n=1 Tax=Saccostrea cuccullata TaxID=36930 RepID=UPI002ED505A3